MIAPQPVPIICPRCASADKPGAKPTMEINNGTVTCVGCGHTFTIPPQRPTAA